MTPTSSTATMRLFIAVDPSSENRASLGQTIDHLQTVAPRARWVRAEKLHLTLVFLGDIQETKLSLITDALNVVAELHSPFAVHFANGGTFGKKNHARVLWAGIGGNIEALGALQKTLVERLEPVGYVSEFRAYIPHLTLARAGDFRGDSNLALCADELEGRFLGETTIREVVLYHSETSEKGATYTALFRAALRT